MSRSASFLSGLSDRREDEPPEPPPTGTTLPPQQVTDRPEQQPTIPPPQQTTTATTLPPQEHIAAAQPAPPNQASLNRLAIRHAAHIFADHPDSNVTWVPDDNEGWLSNLQHEVSEGLALPTIGGAAQAVGGAISGAAGATGRAVGGAAGGAVNWVNRAARGEIEMSPETAEAVNQAAQGPADAYQDIAGVTGGTTEGPPDWQRGLGWYADTSGATDLWNTSRSVIHDPAGAAQNVWNAADTAVSNPTEVWRGAQRIVPAVWDYYKEHPEAIGKLAWGAAISAGTGALVRSGVGALTSSVRGAAATSRVARGATTAMDVAEDVSRITRPARRAFDTAEDVEDVVRPAMRTARPTLRGALVEAADTGIERLDRTLNRVIGAREELRNRVFNLPRRALGMGEKDLRIGAVARQRERWATSITQGAGAEGNPSSWRQTLGTHVGPTRQMPELPEGTSLRTQRRIENTWRNNAINKVLPGGNPTDEINTAIDIAEDPLGYLVNRFLPGGDEGDELSEYNYLTPGQARGLTRSRRPTRQVSTPGVDRDVQGFYQRTPAPSSAPVSLGQGSTSNPYTGTGGYQPGRGWRAANSPMYRDEQEPMYG